MWSWSEINSVSRKVRDDGGHLDSRILVSRSWLEWQKKLLDSRQKTPKYSIAEDDCPVLQHSLGMQRVYEQLETRCPEQLVVLELFPKPSVDNSGYGLVALRVNAAAKHLLRSFCWVLEAHWNRRDGEEEEVSHVTDLNVRTVTRRDSTTCQIPR